MNKWPRQRQERLTKREHPPVVELSIEEIVLHDFSFIDRQRLGEVVTHELTRLLTERDLGSSLRQHQTTARIDGGVFRITHEGKKETVGTQIAQTVYNSLTGKTSA